MQGQREHALGYGSGSAAWRNDDRNASCCDRRKIDVIDTDTSTGDDPQPRSALEKRDIDDGIGTDDRADGVRDVRFVWIGDERDLLAEDPSDQRRFDRAKCHDHRAVDSHDITQARWRVSRGRRRMSRSEPLEPAARCRSHSTLRRPQ